MASTTYSETTALCIRSMDLMTEGTREDFEPVYHPEGVNREAAVEPPATRQPGPAGFWATAQWLRAAMSGRHTGDFVNFRPWHRHRRQRHAAHRAGVRHHPDPLVPHPGRRDHRALG